MNDWASKNVVILGLSLSGIAAAKYLASCGAKCIISERNEAKDDDLQKIKELNSLGIAVEMGANKEITIQNADYVITSPGIPPHAPIYDIIKKHKKETFSEIEVAFDSTTTPFVAITGTNGKTTTTMLISHILKTAGYNAPACGNVGVPPCSLMNEKTDYFVTELSSYQIATSPRFKAQIACFLNYSDDHISWHGGLENYFNAKASLFEGERAPETGVFNALDKKVFEFSKKCKCEKIYFGTKVEGKSVYLEENDIYFDDGEKSKVINVSELKLIGFHNYQNVMAAIAVAKSLKIEDEALINALKTFESVEHRLEYVTTINGTKFYNDSKATNTDAAIYALKSFTEKVLLIAGGRDKGTDLTEFVEEVNNHVHTVILIGEAKARFDEALKKGGFTNIIDNETLQQAVDTALKLKPSVVLLAPACASFDMFKSFEERGKVFKDYVIQKKG